MKLREMFEAGDFGSGREGTCAYCGEDANCVCPGGPTSVDFEEWFRSAQQFMEENGLGPDEIESDSLKKEALEWFHDKIQKGNKEPDAYSFAAEHLAGRRDYGRKFTFDEAAESGFFGGDEPHPVQRGIGTSKRSKMPQGANKYSGNWWMGRSAQHIPTGEGFGDCPMCRGYGTIMTGAEGQNAECPECGGAGGNVVDDGFSDWEQKQNEMDEELGYEPRSGRAPIPKDYEEKAKKYKIKESDPFDGLGDKEFDNIEQWEQDVWEYAEETYGKSVADLEGFEQEMEEAFHNDIPPFEFVDEIAAQQGWEQKMAEAHGERAAGLRGPRKTSSEKSREDKFRSSAEPQVDDPGFAGEDPNDEMFFGDKRAEDFRDYEDPTSSKVPEQPNVGFDNFDDEEGFGEEKPETGFGDAPEGEEEEEEDEFWHGNQPWRDETEVEKSTDVQFPEYEHPKHSGEAETGNWYDEPGWGGRRKRFDQIQKGGFVNPMQRHKKR